MSLPLPLPECLDTAVAIIQTRASPLAKPKGKYYTPLYPERQVTPLSSGSLPPGTRTFPLTNRSQSVT